MTVTLMRYVKPIGDYSLFSFKKIMNNYWYPCVTRNWDEDDVV